jgi:hypothetical protein
MNQNENEYKVNKRIVISKNNIIIPIQLKQIEQVWNWLKTFIHMDIRDTDIYMIKNKKKDT